jgi:hypothetical protein
MLGVLALACPGSTRFALVLVLLLVLGFRLETENFI